MKKKIIAALIVTGLVAGFIPASNEPSSHACMDIWRLPRGSNTLQLCCEVFDFLEEGGA